MVSSQLAFISQKMSYWFPFYMQPDNGLPSNRILHFVLTASDAILSLLTTTSLCDEIFLQSVKITDAISDTNWYRLPIRVQKFIPLLLSFNYYQVQYLDGYKLLISSRDSFRKVRISLNQIMKFKSFIRLQAMKTTSSIILSFRAIIQKWYAANCLLVVWSTSMNNWKMCLKRGTIRCWILLTRVSMKN